jgi:tetratricopeptide (TPR) repeat protein
MGLFDKIKSVFSGTTSDVNPADKGQFVKSFTDKGEQVLIPRSEWRNRVLPDQLKNVWNDPEALYGAIVMAMQDGFFAEVIEAAKHLVEIDKITDRSYNVLGLAYLHTNALSEAEQTLEKGISVSDYKAVMTTNLAKVYVAQGEEQKAMQTLWSAIQLDPNQDNGLDWFTVLEFEKGGEPARLASYKKVAALPNSWRAKLYIARHHLEQKQFDTAKEIYKDILSIASNEPDAIWVITGDLGLNNRVDDIFELVFPIFSVDKHGINGAINMIQACIATKRKKEGLRLLDDFKKLQRYDLLHITNDFENELKKL